MKKIDAAQIDKDFFGDLDTKLNGLNAKLSGLEKDLETLQAKLEQEENKLSAVSDDINQYRKQYHVCNDCKIDIEATQQLIAATKNEIKNAERSALDCWNTGIEKYMKSIEPTVKQFEKVKAELFELYFDLLTAQATVNRIGTNVIPRYHLTDKEAMSAGLWGRMQAPIIEAMRGDPGFFHDNFSKKANGDLHKILHMMSFGNLE